MDINKVIIIGRVAQEPIFRDSRVIFTVATNKFWIDKDTGEKKNRVEYHNCIAWHKLVDIIKMVEKGRLIYVEGHIETNIYEKDGQTIKNKQVVAEIIQFLSKNYENENKRDDNLLP